VYDIGATIALELRAGGVDRGFSPELQVRLRSVRCVRSLVIL
jgi:hypothetical protein